MEKRPARFVELIRAASDFIIMTIGAKVSQKKFPVNLNELRIEMIRNILTDSANVNVKQLNDLQKIIYLQSKIEFDKIMNVMNNVIVSLRIREQKKDRCRRLFKSATRYEKSRRELTHQAIGLTALNQMIREHEESLNNFLIEMQNSYLKMSEECENLSFEDDGIYPEPSSSSESS